MKRIFRFLAALVIALVAVFAASSAAFADGFGQDGFTPPQGSCQTNGGGGVGAGQGDDGTSVGANGQGGVDQDGLPNSSTDIGPLCQ